MSWHKITKSQTHKISKSLAKCTKNAAKMRMMWHFFNATCHVNHQTKKSFENIIAGAKDLSGIWLHRFEKIFSSKYLQFFFGTS